MKNTFKLLGLFALVAAIGFSLIGCDSDPDPIVTISGTPTVGQTLTATSSGPGFSGADGFEWFRSSSPGAEAWGTSIGVGPSHVLTSADADNFISARRFNSSRDEYIWSNAIGPIDD